MTFGSTPPAYSSVNDSLVYVVYDANAVDPLKENYKYVGEVWVNGTKQFTGKYFPQPDNGRGIMDLSNIIREYCIASFKAEQGEGEFSVSIVVKIREEYDGTVGAVVATDSTRVFFNHYNARYNDFTLLATYANKPATTRPTTIYMVEGCTTYYLPYFATTTSSFDVVINGVTTTITPTAINTMHRINIAIGATSNYNAVIDGVTYNVVVICEGLYTNYYLHFLNQFGGYETMLFNKARRKTLDIERKTFQQLPYRVSSSGIVSVKSGNVMHPQKSVFASKFTEKLKVSTDLLRDEEYQWLFQLIVSPEVYLEDNGTLYPIVISDSNYEFKEYMTDKLTNLSVNIEFGTSYKAQYR